MEIEKEKKKFIFFRKFRLLFLLASCFISVAFAMLSKTFNINGTAQLNRQQWDIYLENVQVKEGSVEPVLNGGATILDDDDEPLTVTFTVPFTSPGEYYDFTVDIVNAGSIDAMIDSIIVSSLTEDEQRYLEYVVEYAGGTPLNEKDKLPKNTVRSIHIRFAMKDVTDGYNLEFIPEGGTSKQMKCSLYYVQADNTAVTLSAQELNDLNWVTISNLIISGRNNFQVGDRKEVDLGPELGSHYVRLSNTSYVGNCGNVDYGETACGYVFEFENIIAVMKFSEVSSTLGGYPSTTLYSYLQNDLYNMLPADLKSVLITTRVFSGHSKSGTDNFMTYDKLYFLSPIETWNTSWTYDTSASATRQLDYYARGNKGIKYVKDNPDPMLWWLRSPYSPTDTAFWAVSVTGRDASRAPGQPLGVSPAFRIKFTND